MRYFLLGLFLNGLLSLAAQPLIHSHNDYHKPLPLRNALNNKAFSVEADVYLVNKELRVAHERNELPTAPLLQSLYLQPIIELFKKHQGRISNDKDYAPVLMIDIKDNGEVVIEELIKLLAPHRSVFDRSVNKRAVQIVISGDRSAISKWSSYPAYIFFDGRPNEYYDSIAMKRVAFISDSYANYIRSKDSVELNIKQLAQKIHNMNKLLRLWAIPDDPQSWNWLNNVGIDIINTDKVEECRKYFSTIHQ